MSAPDAPAMPTTAASRLRWTLADGWTVVRRNLWQLKSQPGQLVTALIFPVALVVLFGYVFGSAIAVPGGNYREYLMPGLFSMVSFFGVVVNAMAIAADKSKGVMDRFRSMPMARLAVPFGQAGADIIQGTIAVLLMAVCGLVVGWRAHEGVARTAAGLALIILFRYALSWAGVYTSTFHDLDALMRVDGWLSRGWDFRVWVYLQGRVSPRWAPFSGRG